MKIITKDIYEGSYLLSKGMTLKDVLGNKQKIIFVFEGNEEKLSTLKELFNSKQAEANIYKLRSNINYLRDIIFSKNKPGTLIQTC